MNQFEDWKQFKLLSEFELIANFFTEDPLYIGNSLLKDVLDIVYVKDSMST